MTNFAARLHDAVRSKGTPALVGLDPRFDQLPAKILEAARRREPDCAAAQVASAFEEFCCGLIDVVAPLVPAVKPQAAFFEEYGHHGTRALARVMRHARDAGVIVICDAKRGDIGSTAEAYARAYLAGEDPDAASWCSDALTVNPYLGADTLEPFVKVGAERGAGIYVLVRTSNPGAKTFQDRVCDDLPMYRHVARTVEELAQRTTDGSAYGFVGAVVGATYPKELAELRAAMPHTPFLVPGYGSQGGTAADVSAAFDSDGLGTIVNSSRGINFAYLREPYASQFGPERWEDAVQAATHEMIADLSLHTPAGRLRDVERSKT
ncbi:MAG: orotidine-5'-phosphate decarboxylase [Planctomycetaceae bacterium]